MLSKQLKITPSIARTLSEYQECSNMCFSETWLQDHIPSSLSPVSLWDAFWPLGGCALDVLVINDDVIQDTLMWSFFFAAQILNLKLVFIHIISQRVQQWCFGNIQHSAITHNTCDTISTFITKLQTKHSYAFVKISGDFNQASLSATLPTAQQLIY